MTQKQFIEEVAKYVQKYAPQYGIKVHSPIISQFCLESGYGTSNKVKKTLADGVVDWRHNYVGLKWRNNRCAISNDYFEEGTVEQNVDGRYTGIVSKFFRFKSLEDCVIGYFQFTNIPSYSNLKGVTDPQTYLENIKKDKYATSIDYVQKNMNVIKKWNLTKYDPSIKNNDTTVNKKEETKMGYTNSSLVDYIKLSPNCTKPRKNKIKKIVIHHMAGNLTIEACGNGFSKTSRKASSNYGIGTDGRIGLYVEECNRAWTSGNSTVDNQAITIEVANDVIGGNWHVSDKALEKTIELCADICRRNGIEKLVFTGNKNGNLVAHRYYQATQCPGEYLYSKFPYIANEVNKLLGVKTEVNKPSSEKTKVTYITHRIPNNKWGSEITGYNLVDSMGYSGSFGKEIDKVAIKLSEGSITYCAHRLNGNWGSEITGYSTTDTNKYAGSTNKPIDAITIKANGINGKLKYRVHRIDGKWGGWITGYSKTDTKNYAGSFGKPIDAIQIGIE